MTKETSKPTVTPQSKNTKEVEHESDDGFEEGEYASFAGDIDKEDIKADARRKIEIYWEKKRLREQFEDFDESEFGF